MFAATNATITIDHKKSRAQRELHRESVAVGPSGELTCIVFKSK